MPHIVMSIASGNHSKSLPLFLWCVVDHIKAGMRLGVMQRTSVVLGRMLKITLEIMLYNAGDPSIVGIVPEIVLRLRC